MKVQDYCGVSNVMGPKNVVGSQLQKGYTLDLPSYCLCHFLNLSVLSASAVPRSMKDMMDARV